MSEISKQALKVDNNTSFPNNNAGAITPAILRAFNTNMIDSLVDEISYNVDSASWNSSISQLNAYTASATGLNTGSLMKTGSVSGNVLTFTKGDSTTFSLIVATGSGADLTSLNAFTASQLTINSGYNSTTASLNSSVTQLNASSASQQTSINALNTNSASVNTSASLALVTASFSGNTLTFTKGNGTTFGVVIPDVSGSTINTGSFATTGSNTFIGDQTITGSLNVSGSVVYIKSAGAITFENGTTTNFFGNTNFTNPGRFPILNVDNSGSNGYYGFNAETTGRIYQDFSGSVNARILAITGSGGTTNTGSLMVTGSIAGNILTFTKGDASTFNLTIPSATGSVFDTGSFATTGSNTFTGNQLINKNGGEFQIIDPSNPSYGTTAIGISGASGGLIFKQSGSVLIEGVAGTKNLTFYGTGSFTKGIAISDNDFVAGATIRYDTTNDVIIIEKDGSFKPSLNIEGGLTASLENGYAWVGNASGRTTLVATSSFGGGGGTTYENPTLNPYSGSLILVGNTFTSSSFAHISASANGQVNLVFKNNNNTADTIISGSNNIFTNPAAPTAGFKRYIGGANNIINTSNAPQISGSMGFSPTMTQNYQVAATFSMRGPVSSSAWTITNNVIQGNVNIGSSATNNAEKAVAGLTMQGNSINGAVNFIANRSLHTQTNQISNNAIVGGTTTLTAASSSIIYSNNIGGNIGVTNNASGGLTSNSANSINVARNLFVGSANTITASGSQDPGDTSGTSYLRHIEDNQILGVLNGVNLPYAATGSNSLNATMIAGYGLGVTGSNASGFVSGFEYGGSAFFGRYNAQNGNRAQSAQTVFAVGTGTSTTRKTGFLIDSGSNTFVEGTLNVSGSSTFTGSLNGLTLTRGSGNNNTALGFQVLENAVSGGNIAIGTSALRFNTSGTDNVALGDNALNVNTSGDRNMAIGSNTLDSNTTGTLNVAIGNATLASLVDGSANVGIGFEALKNQTTSNDNVGIGKQTLNQNISGSGNIAIGATAGYNETGSNNFYITNNNFGSINADRSGSLMWGKMDNTTANQTLQINARTRFTNEVLFTTGSNQQAGTAVLDGANPGAVTVSNSLVTANSIIMVSKQTLAHPNGYVAVSAKSAGSFTITSNHNGDTDTVGWFIINNS